MKTLSGKVPSTCEMQINTPHHPNPLLNSCTKSGHYIFPTQALSLNYSTPFFQEIFLFSNQSQLKQLKKDCKGKKKKLYQGVDEAWDLQL